MTASSATGPFRRAAWLRAATACLLAGTAGHAQAQSLTRDLFTPQRGAFVAPQDLPLQRTATTSQAAVPPGRADPYDTDDMRGTRAAPSRLGAAPEFGLQRPSLGPSGTGYDAQGRKRQQPSLRLGAPRPKSIGPGSPVVTPAPPPARPLPPSQAAAKPPVAATFNGTLPGQPLRRRLKADDDPFGPVGDYAGSFLIKGAVELNGGYDSNPGRIATPQASGFYKVSPELMVTSDWDRHALVADLRGSFTGYGHDFNNPGSGVTSAPRNLDRPDFDGHVDGRIDVTRDTRLLGQGRLIVGTDNPGSPNNLFGLQKFPIYTQIGVSGGIDQTFNRLQVTAIGSADRRTYQQSVFTDGSTEPNNDRNFNQYAGTGRVSYEVLPWLKPFVEGQADTRQHDTAVDRYGYMRDSNGGYIKGGTSFELTRLLTGEASIGWAARTYSDPRLLKLEGLLTSASLIWTVTPLTKFKLGADTSIDESPLAGVSGVLTRTYTAEVDHDFRRWLTAVGKFTYATYDYQGSGRSDRFNSLEGNLIYKMSRQLWVKGTLRRDQLDSNVTGGSYNATVVMLGVRLQN
ncbi:outer membrane beta-barrel protein [Rhodopseudomonas palustris]|uniref:outer membrane beta-barrel protein n=2 Tax=Rhodopseudomonas TaxID=1073 RepID=UPI003CC81FDF|nr:outer membrane beta-barrel protein [Rhodopseudomonas palustris]